LEYIAGLVNRRETPRMAAMADAARTKCVDGAEELIVHTYLSIIFAYHTNMSILSTLGS
jgi:hypothetical protein